MNIKEEIKHLIEKSVKSLGAENVPVLVEVPKEISHGDYSTNIALVLAKKSGKDTVEVAREIAGNIKDSAFEKIEVAGPGFINFYLSKDFFIDNLKKALKEKDKFGKNNLLKNKKVVVEYTNANPFKVLHIGHINDNAIGESIARILDFQGAKVKKVCYQGDVGLHVAKAIYGKLKNPEHSWQKSYVFGSGQYEKSESAKKEIIELNKKIYERSDKKINNLYDKGKKESLNNFDKIYKKLGTKFDRLFFESELKIIGKKIVEENIGKVFEKGEKGAIIFKGEKYGSHTRVFINSERLPTYEAKELALAKVKYNKYKYDKSIIVTGNEIKEYFKVVLSTMKQIFPELERITRHVTHGMLRLPEGKMSSRTGNVVTAEDLLNKVEKLVVEKLKNRDLSDKEKKEIARIVAVGAIKYSILKQAIGKDIIYDINKSISFEGDSGPYLQYSYARASSVLEKAIKEKIKPSLKNIPNGIIQLEKMMHYFPEVVEKAGKDYESHFITLYLTELAREFSNYYAKNKIVDKNDKLSPYKVALTEAFSIIMKNGLYLLGIEALDKM